MPRGARKVYPQPPDEVERYEIDHSTDEIVNYRPPIQRQKYGPGPANEAQKARKRMEKGGFHWGDFE